MYNVRKAIDTLCDNQRAESGVVLAVKGQVVTIDNQFKVFAFCNKVNVVNTLDDGKKGTDEYNDLIEALASMMWALSFPEEYPGAFENVSSEEVELLAGVLPVDDVVRLHNLCS